MGTIEQRPECLEDEMLVFLDDLRESGEVNMCGAAQNLRVEFWLEKRESRAVLKYWMETFGKREGEMKND